MEKMKEESPVKRQKTRFSGVRYKHKFELPYFNKGAGGLFVTIIARSTGLIKVISEIVVDYVLQPPALCSTECTFAALLGSGRVVTWGHGLAGGDSSAVQEELKDQVVQHIYSTG